MGTIAAFVITGVLFFACWFLAAVCSRAHILVRNESGGAISNLLISGACKERRVDTLAPLSAWSTATPYQSGGQIQLSFVSASKSYVASPETGTNLSGHCGIFFLIGSNMVVTSEVRK